MRIIIEIDDRQVSVQKTEPSQQAAAAVNAGGPPQALVERLGAQAPRPADPSTSTASTGAINAGGPPLELVQRLGGLSSRATSSSTGADSTGAIDAGGPPPELILSDRPERKVHPPLIG